MNLITQTYDADKWQLMPKVATDEMNAAAAYTETFAEAYTALLATAPQPPEVDSMATASVSAPVVPDKKTGLCVSDEADTFEIEQAAAYANGWNDCRAAMLKE